MKKNVALKWVKALRSGKYKQGTHRLQNRDSYCCLGVLCEIAPKSVSRNRLGWGFLRGTCLSAQKEVQKWAELATDCGWVAPEYTSLACKNDTGASFEEIADLIEKHWEKL